MPKKILITNTVALNGGDAAILHALLFLLRQAFGEETEFVVYDSAPEVAARYYPTIQFRKLIYLRAAGKKRFGLLKSIAKRWNLTRLRLALACWPTSPKCARLFLSAEDQIDLSNYQNADLIFSTGGTYLVDHYSLTPRIFDYEVSLTLQRPLIFFTQSLGPFKKQSHSTRRKLKNIFENARLILLRDERSLKNLEELNLKGANCQIAADAVFALGDPAKFESAKTNSLRGTRLKVAVSVRDWRRFSSISQRQGMEKYKEALRALAAHLVNQHQAEVVFISTCQGIPEYQFDDSAVAHEIYESLSPETKAHVQIDRAFHSPSDLIVELGKFDVAIGTRMHFCVLALLAGVPVLPIAYEFKTNELFTRLSLGEWVQDIEKLDSPALLKTFDAFLEALPKIRPALFSQVELERQSAVRSGWLAKEALEKTTLR